MAGGWSRPRWCAVVHGEQDIASTGRSARHEAETKAAAVGMHAAHDGGTVVTGRPRTRTATCSSSST